MRSEITSTRNQLKHCNFSRGGPHPKSRQRAHRLRTFTFEESRLTGGTLNPALSKTKLDPRDAFVLLKPRAVKEQKQKHKLRSSPEDYVAASKVRSVS